MTAVEVCQVVQDLDVDVVRRHHLEMSTVIAGLASDAGIPWPWTHADPTVALLRSLARLARVAPDATSAQAPSLCHRLRDQARRSDLATASSELGVASDRVAGLARLRPRGGLAARRGLTILGALLADRGTPSVEREIAAVLEFHGVDRSTATTSTSTTVDTDLTAIVDRLLGDRA